MNFWRRSNAERKVNHSPAYSQEFDGRRNWFYTVPIWRDMGLSWAPY